MTVKFAPVGPFRIMEGLSAKGISVIGDYHLLLAHEVLANPDGWYYWAERLRHEFSWAGLSEPLLIMDSSVIELGMPMEAHELLEASRIVKAQVMVLPDVIGDQDATHQLIEDYFESLGEVDLEHQPQQHMFVPQGTSFPEYLYSLEWASQISDIDWVGLPRDALKFDGILSRRQLVDACSIIMPEAPIHLLGMSDNILDDVLTCRHSPMVMGIDSAVPIRAGLKGMQLRLSCNDYGKREDYWEAHTIDTPLPIANLQWMREVIQPL